MRVQLKKADSSTQPSGESIELESAPTILYLAAAPEIAECEKLFHPVRRGTVCPQYPGGTRIDNMGCRIGELTSVQNFLTKLEKFQRR
jgi:hypothetical protein